MAERKVKLIPVQVTYTCDSCGIGQMKSTGEVYMTYPPKYPHKCQHCKAEDMFNVEYPTIRYETEGD